jgi:hypothetical protein
LGAAEKHSEGRMLPAGRRLKTPNLKHDCKSERKDKFPPVAHHESTEEEQKYSSTLSLTSVLGGIGSSLHRKQGGLRGPSGRVRKISTPRGFEAQTV